MVAELQFSSEIAKRLQQSERLIRVETALDPDTFLVKRFEGREALSTPFIYQIELISAQGKLELKQLVGQPLRLVLDGPYSGYSVHGYVREFASEGRQGQLTTYRAEMAPWFAFLEYTCNCRIFQDRDVLQIIEEVFAGYAQLARYRYDLNPTRLPALSYCVQYNESDFAFVSRLLEDAGLYYSFVHDEDGHTLVISDNSTGSVAHGGLRPLTFITDQGTKVSHGLHRWGARRRVGPSVQALRSFDFKQPSQQLDGDEGNQVPLGLLPPLEQYRYDGAARFADSRIGKALATVRNEEATWPTKLFDCSGNAADLEAGSCFSLERHPDFIGREDSDREFVVVSLQRKGHNNFAPDPSYAEDPSVEIQAQVLRRHIPYRPLRQTRWPRMEGPQTATVVGPPGEELHADAYGRVKVQFHWDRQLDRRENASCWIRVAGPWAGADMGGVSPPRVGQEVVVDFLDGDPDRPIITGRVYNEWNMPPFGLEVSGMKSKTVKGAGWNEITMHDSAGGELLNMRAQRDMVTTVLNDQSATVQNNKSTSVAGNQSLTVGGNQTIAVTGDRKLNITGSDTVAVTGARTTTVDGAVAQTYRSGQTHTIEAAGYTETITGAYKTTLTGNYTSTRQGAWEEHVTGTATRTVDGKATEIVLDGGREVTIKGLDKRGVNGAVEDDNVGERTVTTTGNAKYSATETYSIGSAGAMTVGSERMLTLGVGASMIEIVGGAITIASNGSTIVINASGVTINGAEIKLN